MWWCLVLGSAGSKMVSACTGMSHLTILKSMASRISRLWSLRGAQFRSLSNEDTLVKRLWSWITNLVARRWMPSKILMSLIRYGSHIAAQYSSLDLMSEMQACSLNFFGHFDKFLFRRSRVELDLAAFGYDCPIEGRHSGLFRGISLHGRSEVQCHITSRICAEEWIWHKNSSRDEIANVNFLTTISHTRRPTSKYRKRDKPTSFNKLDDRSASTAHEVLNFSIC